VNGAGRILLTGATGYVGGRLRERLEREGAALRCLARNPDHLHGRVLPTTRVVRGDVLDPGSLEQAMEGVRVAFYLVHSLASGEGFEEEEARGAENFARAARQAEVERIVYLGGLGHGEQLSAHLRSRHRVGEILRASGVPTLELRAGVVIGSGSLSFEMIRALVRKLPVMVVPRWTRIETQPIGVEDIVDYLLRAVVVPLEESSVVEVGARDALSYRELMAEVARQRGLRRLMVPVPVLSPRLSSLWLGLVTPVYARVGRRLIDGLRNETVVRDPEPAHRLFGIEPMSSAEAVRRALAKEEREVVQTTWADAVSSVGSRPGFAGRRFRSRIVDSRSVRLRVSPEEAMAPVMRIGGDEGWYYGDWLWRIRGWLDLLAGGAGLRRGRRDPRDLHPGDALDFWRVEEVEPARLLRLRAEMKLPGRAWLQFEARPLDGGRSELRQTALFDPVGLGGLLYWYALWPVHAFVFRGMLRGIARRAEAGDLA
jgi:uncharacterized protein YbjT (DUF2867 family)